MFRLLLVVVIKRRGEDFFVKLKAHECIVVVALRDLSQFLIREL